MIDRDDFERMDWLSRFEFMGLPDLRLMLRDTLAHYDDRTDRQFLRDLTGAIAQREKADGEAPYRGLQANPG